MPTPYDDPRNVKRRIFCSRPTIQGHIFSEGEWDVSSQEELAEFREEVLREFTEHLDACLSNGLWEFRVLSYDPLEE